MKKFLFVPMLATLFFSCVPKTQYEALTIERDYYRNKTVEADSLADLRALNTYSEVENQDLESANLVRQLESVVATNRALNSSYQALSKNYETLLAQNQKLLTNTGEEVTGLQQSLAERTLEVSRREAELREMEIDIQAREGELARTAGGEKSAEPTGFNRIGGAGQTYGLNGQQNKALQLNGLQNEINQVLNYLPGGAYLVAPAGSNRLQLTLADGVLTTDGFSLSQNGTSLVQRLVSGLRKYPSSEVVVVGHADGGDNDALAAYEDSTDKAIGIVQAMINAGINPGKVSAAGQGFYAPITDSSTEQGRAANRRVDVMITLPD